MSGVMFHPSVNLTGAGVSFGSPSAAPLSAHADRRSRSARVSRAAFENLWSYSGSTCHGGIFCVSTAALIARAHGLASA